MLGEGGYHVTAPITPCCTGPGAFPPHTPKRRAEENVTRALFSVWRPQLLLSARGPRARAASRLCTACPLTQSSFLSASKPLPPLPRPPHARRHVSSSLHVLGLGRRRESSPPPLPGRGRAHPRGREHKAGSRHTRAPGGGGGNLEASSGAGWEGKG